MRTMPLHLKGRVMSREALLPLLWQFMEDWVESKKETEMANGKAPSFAKVVYMHFLRRFGLHNLADDKVPAPMICTLC